MSTPEPSFESVPFGAPGRTEHNQLLRILETHAQLYKAEWDKGQRNESSAIPASLDGEACNARNGNFSTESLPEVTTAHSTHLDEFPKAVALLVPDFYSSFPDSQALDSCSCITLVWLKIDEPFSNYHTERIPVPIYVLRCYRSIITCIDRSFEWNSTRIVTELFKRGYGHAVFKLGYESRVKYPRDKLITHLNESFLHLAEIDSIGLWLGSAQVNLDPIPDDVPICKGHTRYSVQFPLHDNPGEHVSVRVDCPSAGIISTVHIPNVTIELKITTARVDHPDSYLDLERLVSELIQIGCGSHTFEPSQTPQTLSNGGTLVQYVHQSNKHNLSELLAFVEPLVDADVRPYTSQPPREDFQVVSQPPVSNFASPMSLITASSTGTFISARSALSSSAYSYASGRSGPGLARRIETIREDDPLEPSAPGHLQQLHTDYYTTLHQQNIIQPFDKELNWSGKGQHVTFQPRETVPLTVLSYLGSSLTAKVEKVLCKRIALARKTIRCSRKWTVADASLEVYHLQKLRHFHIIQLVGSYLQGRNFSILMYPVADFHLGVFLEDTYDMKQPITSSYPDRLHQYQLRTNFLASTLGCLSSAVAFIHARTTKHMDIKPQNILIRDISADSGRNQWWRIYLADFGLSRSFASQDHSQTDGPTSRTPRYCAPEVYDCSQRGRSADIFSLGCVFLEILTVYTGHCPQDFADARRGKGDDDSFHANLDIVQTWIRNVIIGQEDFRSGVTDNVVKMISEAPDQRPTALELRAFFSSLEYTNVNLDSTYPFLMSRSCCSMDPEPYEAYQLRDEKEATDTALVKD